MQAAPLSEREGAGGVAVRRQFFFRTLSVRSVGCGAIDFYDVLSVFGRSADSIESKEDMK
jgi:hypothetical protein